MEDLLDDRLSEHEVGSAASDAGLAAGLDDDD
jgi:hypothetical protein